MREFSNIKDILLKNPLPLLLVLAHTQNTAALDGCRPGGGDSGAVRRHRPDPFPAGAKAGGEGAARKSGSEGTFRRKGKPEFPPAGLLEKYHRGLLALSN